MRHTYSFDKRGNYISETQRLEMFWERTNKTTFFSLINEVNEQKSLEDGYMYTLLNLLEEYHIGYDTPVCQHALEVLDELFCVVMLYKEISSYTQALLCIGSLKFFMGWNKDEGTFVEFCNAILAGFGIG